MNMLTPLRKTRGYGGHRLRKAVIIMVITALLLIAAAACLYFYLCPGGRYTAADFGVTTAVSPVDFNGNGVDDYRDIMLGARRDAQNHVTYNAAYFVGGYPPDNAGVCADEIWRAFKNAGYDLKAMVDKDIAADTAAYLPAGAAPDPNIDFRRVSNLKIFFKRHAVPLTLDIKDRARWQPGDIVILGRSHIGVISDIRDKNGVPYLIHNNNQPWNREEDALPLYAVTRRVNGHYRFDASLADKSLLIAWAN